LRDALAGTVQAIATLAVEQGKHNVVVRIELGDSVNSITLSKQADTAERLACFLEELANAENSASEVSEQFAVIVLRDDARRLFAKSIAGYRCANADLNKAIDAENWVAINGAQGRRDMHANTIALIANMYSAVTEEGARP
jgi:hypothetical protein